MNLFKWNTKRNRSTSLPLRVPKHKIGPPPPQYSVILCNDFFPYSNMRITNFTIRKLGSRTNYLSFKILCPWLILMILSHPRSFFDNQPFSLIICAGLSTTIQFSGTSLFTTYPAPITAFWPITTRKSIALLPMAALFLINVFCNFSFFPVLR